jgi:hypothetical protein
MERDDVSGSGGGWWLMTVYLLSLPMADRGTRGGIDMRGCWTDSFARGQLLVDAGGGG